MGVGRGLRRHILLGHKAWLVRRGKVAGYLILLSGEHCVILVATRHDKCCGERHNNHKSYIV